MAIYDHALMCCSNPIVIYSTDGEAKRHHCGNCSKVMTDKQVEQATCQHQKTPLGSCRKCGLYFCDRIIKRRHCGAIAVKWLDHLGAVCDKHKRRHPNVSRF